MWNIARGIKRERGGLQRSEGKQGRVTEAKRHQGVETEGEEGELQPYTD